MAEIGWKWLASMSPEHDYLAMASYLPLKRFRTIPRFLAFTREIQKQLRESKGLVGYSLRVKFLRRDFWTLSVWESEQDLTQFVQKIPHGKVMVALKPHMAETKFVQWKLEGSTVRPSWEEAFKRLQVG